MMKRSIFLLSEDDVTRKRSKGQRGNDGEGVASLSGGDTREGQRGGGRGESEVWESQSRNQFRTIRTFGG